MRPDPAPGRPAVAKELLDALHASDIDRVFHVPDSVFAGMLRVLEESGVAGYTCAREDEAVAMAAGSYLAGKLAAVMMEGSGVGYSALVLARAQLQRTPMLLLVSHTRGVGEAFDYHGATRIVGEGVLAGLGIPYQLVTEADSFGRTVERAATTARGQKSIVGLLVAPYVVLEDTAGQRR